jgi:hypothetical protein
VISSDALVFYIKAPGRGIEIAEVRPLRCVGFEECEGIPRADGIGHAAVIDLIAILASWREGGTLNAARLREWVAGFNTGRTPEHEARHAASAKVGAPLLGHYSASKFAVLGWTQALARNSRRRGHSGQSGLPPAFVTVARNCVGVRANFEQIDSQAHVGVGGSL